MYVVSQVVVGIKDSSVLTSNALWTHGSHVAAMQLLCGRGSVAVQLDYRDSTMKAIEHFNKTL